jgi:hypothetical protein
VFLAKNQIKVLKYFAEGGPQVEGESRIKGILSSKTMLSLHAAALEKMILIRLTRVYL